MKKKYLREIIVCLLVLSCVLIGCFGAFGAPPVRIVSLAPSVTEILYDLGAGGRIAAVTDFCDYPEAAKRKPKIGGFANPSLEAVVAARPDLVIMAADGNPAEFHQRLKNFGINTYVFRAKRLADLPRGIRDLGVALGMKRIAEKRASDVEKQLAALAKRTKSSARGQKVRKALFIIHPEPLLVAGRETVIDDALKLLKLDNIAAGAGSKYPKYNIEEIIRRSPDVIFIGRGPMSANLSQSLMKRLETLEAVRKGRVYYTSELLYRLTPRTILGIEEIAACPGVL
jgi:iron complex transport system substrate-binding protein